MCLLVLRRSSFFVVWPLLFAPRPAFVRPPENLKIIEQLLVFKQFQCSWHPSRPVRGPQKVAKNNSRPVPGPSVARKKLQKTVPGPFPARSRPVRLRQSHWRRLLDQDRFRVHHNVSLACVVGVARDRLLV